MNKLDNIYVEAIKYAEEIFFNDKQNITITVSPNDVYIDHKESGYGHVIYKTCLVHDNKLLIKYMQDMVKKYEQSERERKLQGIPE